METKVTAVNGHGHLTIGGLDTVALASKYGTPLYVMDEDAIRANCRALKNSMDAHYHKKGLVLYASKAFSCKATHYINIMLFCKSRDVSSSISPVPIKPFLHFTGNIT